MSLRGASADALAALTTELESVLSGAGSSASTVGDELFSVAATLRSEGALRRFATDGSIPAEAKAGLVQQVFAGKVDGGTLGVLTKAVSSRWTAARDLADTLEHLGAVAVVRSAGQDGGRLSDELFAFAQVVKANPELRDALSDPARSIQDKSSLLHGLLDGKALPATVTLAVQSLSGTHRTVGAALNEYQKIAAEVHGQGVATVRVARDLSDAERGRLEQALSTQYGRPVHLNLVVDPSVLGGIRVEIGDDVIDGTVSSRLDDARRRLVG
ncbi:MULTISPECIES: F0F1 ATP synthase subunit delta [Nocardioides]|uniref:ATP synthase subunit delta n=1 Tax=Nocardioides lianchengensis TaxID=1045774 RepID=A0A1G6X7C3_9ACTN|nr:F0F1 ATP synthase subunit delta [Nocardioides lianchengensis]NYG09071.1 F-type H+-transporting ATPase subunit delta [Nocardioides lianchengensis]SDD73984.1 F-type H+-transporting ATPase subunit delta [Nocardioides lianchengensis]